MYSGHYFTRWSVCAILGACLCLASCATAAAPFVVALPNGYYLQRDRASHVGLVTRSGRDVLRGPIAAYAVNKTLVAGCVGQWPRSSVAYPNETPFPDSADCRYFILDTESGRLETGLSPEAWRSRLRDYGAPQSLKITAPVLPV